MKNNGKLFEIIGEHGWNIYEDGETVEISQYSPLGEDFSFTVEADDIRRNIIEYAESYDPQEHADIFISMRGTHGIPDDIRALLDDADDIGEMLKALAEAVEQAD